jgi:S-adenosylmethionine hydrolase
MARPIIAMLTDFGTRDHYAGAMKGIALGICPDVTLVNISHDLVPHDVFGAALELAAVPVLSRRHDLSYRCRSRRGVRAARYRGGNRRARFVTPDNGVLTAVLDEHPAKRVIELIERLRAAHRQPDVRRARSVCAAAAWLAGASTSPRSAGPPAWFSAWTSRTRRSTEAPSTARSCASIGSAT